MTMKPAIVIGLSLVLASAVIILVPRFAPPSPSGNTQLAELKDELGKVKSELASTKSELAALRTQPRVAQDAQGRGKSGSDEDSDPNMVFARAKAGSFLDAIIANDGPALQIHSYDLVKYSQAEYRRYENIDEYFAAMGYIYIKRVNPDKRYSAYALGKGIKRPDGKEVIFEGELKGKDQSARFTMTVEMERSDKHKPVAVVAFTLQ